MREKWEDECACFGGRWGPLGVMPGDISPSENVGDTGDRAANWVGVGERSTRLENDTGEPRSTPDIADGGRFTAMPNESPTGRVPSMSGESGSAGERRERDCEASDVGDRDRSIPAFGTSCESVVLVALPPMLGDFQLFLLSQSLIWGIFALSMALLLGYMGQINLGQAAFVALAAYGSTVLRTQAGLGFWLAAPITLFGVVFVAVLVGLITLRLRGPYFVLVMLGFGEIVRLIIANWLSANALSYAVILIVMSIMLGCATALLLGSLGRRR